jgi:hypothetical protein
VNFAPAGRSVTFKLRDIRFWCDAAPAKVKLKAGEGYEVIFAMGVTPSESVALVPFGMYTVIFTSDVGIVKFAVTYPVPFMATMGIVIPFTVTLELFEMLPLVAFTKAVPAANAVKVTVTLPFTFVIPDNAEMLPTVPLLTVQDTLTPATGVEPFKAVALNACVPATLRVAEDGEITIEVRVGGNTGKVAFTVVAPLV